MSRRVRLFVLWAAFAAVAAAAAFAVHRLYATARAEVAEQGERALDLALQDASRAAFAFTANARRAIIRELAGFHDDGLDSALRRWDAANESIVGTFRWNPATGDFFPGWAEAPHLPARAELPRLWREFRAWRATHPEEVTHGLLASGPWVVGAVRTENPDYPADTVRYQAENLDLLRDAGKTPDPWAGYASRAEVPGAPWVIWYQGADGAPVRGCFVDTILLQRALAAELGATRLARLILEPLDAATDRAASWTSAPTRFAPAGDLPGYRIRGELAEVFVRKELEVQLNGAIASGVFALFLLGALALGLYTWREMRDAGRKITFVTQVSHELRTPLTSIRMFADMLLAADLPEEKRRKFAGTIGAESARLGGLIERLLAFNALEKGKPRVSLAAFAVAPLLREVKEETAASLQASGLTAALAEPASTAAVRTDRSILKQALLNLLDNAGKYARGGARVELAVRTEGDIVAIRVADDGPGVSAGVRARLFEPFVQGDATLTSKSPGVGLGLSLSRGLLRQAGGDLVFLPDPRGACFEIRVPAVAAPLAP